MTKTEIIERIAELTIEILCILSSGDNSVAASARWAKLQRERSRLKALYITL